MNLRKLFALLLACVMVLSLVACGGSSSDSSDAAEDTATEGAKVVKIGVYEPQTGDNGAGGKQEILGMEYAHSLFPPVEIGGETYDVQLEIVDNRTTPENGPSAAAELINRDVSIVLGSYGSGVSIAGGEIFAQADTYMAEVVDFIRQNCSFFPEYNVQGKMRSNRSTFRIIGK